MIITDKIKKAVTGGKWYVAYRQRNTNAAFTLLVPPDGTWCADPFLYEADGNHFIFVELYDVKKDIGEIGCFQIEDGVAVFKGTVVTSSYHMSYPCVFGYRRHHYMIPETSANSTVDLYIADSFPDHWHKAKTLLSGIKYVDSTYYNDGLEDYMVTWHRSRGGGYQVTVFRLDMSALSLEYISSKKYSINIGRPAGRLFMEGTELIRPAQNCSRKYGEEIVLYHIDDIGKNGRLIEHETRRISTASLMPHMEGFQRVHTINRDSVYETVDVYHEQLDFMHVPRILFRSHRK